MRCKGWPWSEALQRHLDRFGREGLARLPSDVQLLALIYALALESGSEGEPEIVRPEGASFNPRPARVAQILLQAGERDSLLAIAAAFLVFSPPLTLETWRKQVGTASSERGAGKGVVDLCKGMLSPQNAQEPWFSSLRAGEAGGCFVLAAFGVARAAQEVLIGCAASAAFLEDAPPWLTQGCEEFEPPAGGPLAGPKQGVAVLKVALGATLDIVRHLHMRDPTSGRRSGGSAWTVIPPSQEGSYEQARHLSDWTRKLCLQRGSDVVLERLATLLDHALDRFERRLG